jgi:tetratricopeptide (TPR) repeat protein
VASACALILSVFCCARPALAETISPACPERPAEAKRARALAKDWFKKGELLVTQELYAEALGAFNCSLRMFEHPSTMMNAARAAELAANKPEALALYRRAVAATPEDEKATKAQERIAALEAEIGSATPANEEQRPQPAPESGTVEVAPSAPPPQPAPPPPAEDDGRARLVVPGYVTVAVGGAVVIAGAVFTGLAAKAKKDGEATHSYAAFKEDQDSLKGRQAGAIVCFAVGGAALAAGIALVALGRKGERASDSPAAPEVAVYPGIGSLTVGGTF